MNETSAPSTGPNGDFFDHQPRTRLVFGTNSIERIGELARETGSRKVLLVTDAGIVTAGHSERVRTNLAAAGLDVTIFDKTRENPTTGCVDECVSAAKAAGVDSIIGLGGGSSMDTAKGCNFLLSNGGRMQDYWGVGKATRPMLPFIAVPTTGGTGSECQSAALIVDERTHQKMACLDSKAAARIAILDPKLTLSQPARVTACTGIDALAHSLETAVTTKRNALSSMFSREAFKLCMAGLPEVLARPDDLEARGRMLLGASLAGLAIENSMLGAAHAAANPLTAHYGIAHGQAVGMMLPAVIRFNGENTDVRQLYCELAEIAGLRSSERPGNPFEQLMAQIESLLDLAQMPKSLSECGVESGKTPVLAQEAARQWTANFNPRRVSAEDFERLYERALQPRGGQRL
jgi:alcohol dehydrogenase